MRAVLMASLAVLTLAACSSTRPGSATSSAAGSSGGSGAGSTGASSGSTGTVLPMCAPCSVDADCGPTGTALCVTDNGAPGGHCAPICHAPSDCAAGAVCLVVSTSTSVCYPASQVCVPASTGSSTSGASSTGSGTSTSAGSTGSTSTGGTSGTTGSGSTGTGSSGTTSGTTTGGSTGSTGAALLRFAFTGDTRPGSADDVANYPTQIVQQIVSSMSTKNVAFALDTGDHVKIGKTDTTADAQSFAQQMMQLYTGATSALGKPWYLTMGNHECWNNKSLCTTSDPVLSVFMTYVTQPIATQEPYYTFDVPTPHGVATFVIVADTAWDSTEASWLTSALTHGDSSAYTIIAKHVPTSNTTDFATNADEVAIIEAHKFALLVDSHAHLYSHAGENGREVTLGLGGAPLANPAVDTYGYGLVEQQPDGTLKVTEYDATTDSPLDSFTVSPN